MSIIIGRPWKLNRIGLDVEAHVKCEDETDAAFVVHELEQFLAYLDALMAEHPRRGVALEHATQPLDGMNQRYGVVRESQDRRLPCR